MLQSAVDWFWDRDIYHKAWQIAFMAYICFSGPRFMKLPFPQISRPAKCQRKRGFPSTGPRSLNDVTPQLAADGAHESRGHKETSAPFCTVLSCLEESRLLVEEKLWRVRHQVRDLRGMLEWNAIDIIKRPKNVVIRIFTDQIKAIHYKSNTHRPSIDTCHIASYFARRELDN